jgi:FkbM family methyltransferase
MPAINRLLQLCDRFFECANQVGSANSLAIFSYLLPLKDRKRAITLGGKRFYFYPRADKGVMSHLYKLGYHIKGDVGLIFDVGANIGDETLRFRRFHPEAQIIAIEASARNYELLRDNFSRDKFVHLVHGALWHESGVLSLNTNSSFEAFRVGGVVEGGNIESHGEMVKACTVSDLLERFELHGRRIDIFKIDVEGAEEFIFCKGNLQWLNLVNVFIMEMPDSDRVGSFQRIIAHFSAMNIWGDSYICGENYVFCRKGYGYQLVCLIGLGA